MRASKRCCAPASSPRVNAVAGRVWLVSNRVHSGAMLVAAVVMMIALSATPAVAIGNNPGKWGPTIPFPLIPVAAAVTPNKKLVVWSAELEGGYASADGTTWTATMDLVTGDITEKKVTNIGHNMFCPGTAQLADGSLLVNGGANDLETSIYRPFVGTWVADAKMNIKRGYNSDVVLPDGRVFTLGGSWSGGVTTSKDGEVWAPGRGWTLLPGAKASVILTQDPEGLFRADNHPWLFALGNNKVFQAGPSKQMNVFDVSGTGSSVPAGLRADDNDAMNGNAVMYAWNKILTVGGAPAYNYWPATSNAHIITLNNAKVESVRKIDSMHYPRAFCTSVILPDGNVLVLNGQTTPKQFEDVGAVLHPELWSQYSEKFRVLAPSPVPRTYHSVAILLPDGRVFVGGGGLCNPAVMNYCPVDANGKPVPKNHFNGNIFTPPYLLNEDGTPAARPVITSAPSSAVHGQTITVTTDREVAGFSMIRLSAVTHSINNDQRRVVLPKTRVNAKTYEMTITLDPAVAPPGFYMLFALTNMSVPSHSRMIKIS